MTNSVSGLCRPPQKNKFPTRKSTRALSRPLLLISWSRAARQYFTESYSRPSCRPRLSSIYPQSVTCHPSATPKSQETDTEPSPRNNQTRSLIYTMSFPGMTPPMGGLGGGAGAGAGNMQGMNEQEQMMVKGVSSVCRGAGTLCWSTYGIRPGP